MILNYSNAQLHEFLDGLLFGGAIAFCLVCTLTGSYAMFSSGPVLSSES